MIKIVGMAISFRCGLFLCASVRDVYGNSGGACTVTASFSGYVRAV